MRGHTTATLLIAIGLGLTALVVHTQGANEPERVLIRCARPCDVATRAVVDAGGSVSYRFTNLDAIAAEVPAAQRQTLSRLLGDGAVRKDLVVPRPAPIEPVDVDGAVANESLEGDRLTEFAAAAPANYNFNNALTGASALHANGIAGQNMVVAVIDSGVQIAATALGPVATGTVIGGETFVPASIDPVRSATSRLNDWHGTAVTSMIAAHANFIVANANRLVQSLRIHAPASVSLCAVAGCPANTSLVPMIGTAPAAKVYALKVFPSQDGGAATSWILAALDRVLTLKKNFDSGMPAAPVSGTGTENDPFVYNSLNIQVANLSLGGFTLFAGNDLEDVLLEDLLAANVLPVVSAGNDGFAAMTGGSPGTSFAALTVASASTATHERVLRDVQFGVGTGILFRPTSHVQTSDFSSRGPTADGRLGPHLTANGSWSFVNAFAAVASGALVSCGSPLAPPSGANACASRLLFVSGTSFSGPTVAGAAALLRQVDPSASAIDVRRALIRGADPALLGDGSTVIDQGAGFLNVPDAVAELASGGSEGDDEPSVTSVGDEPPDEVGAGGRSVSANVSRAGLRMVGFRNDRFTSTVDQLKPGQVAQFFIPSDERTDRFVVHITDIVAPGPQNTLFGDDLFVMGVDAPTSGAFHRINSSNGAPGVFVNANATFVIEQPQTGLVRLAIQGDWTNGGVISAKVTIERQRGSMSRRTARGPVYQDDLVAVEVTMPAGVSQGVFELFWKQNWGRYPTNDLDMYLLDPTGTLNQNGASLSSPERVVISNPAAGVWTVLIDAFLIHSSGPQNRAGRDDFTLRVSADGQAIRR